METVVAGAMSRLDAPRFFYLTGCDGTGKTTQADLLCAHLRRLGARPRRVWLRFPFLFSLPLLAYARWRKLSWHEDIGGARHGYWDFRASRLLKTLLPWTLLVDAALAALIRVYLPLWSGETVVCERFVLDMLVDMAVAFDDAALSRRWPGRLFSRLLPRQATIVVLDLDAPTIRARRYDLQSDRRLEERLEMFRRLAADLALPLISSAAPMSEVSHKILNQLGVLYGG
jgi:thymidylate kinase